MAVSGPLGTYPGIGSPGPSPSSPVPPQDAGLSGGAIAGIVIGVVFCVGISAVVISKAS